MIESEKIFKEKVILAVKNLEEFIKENDIPPNVEVNALLHMFVLLCIHNRAKKESMMDMFSYFWDDLEKKYREKQENNDKNS